MPRILRTDADVELLSFFDKRFLGQKTKKTFVVALYTLLMRWDIQTTAINMFKITHQTEALRSAINT